MQIYLWGSCVLLSIVVSAWGYATGAPPAVCEDMLPKHHVDPQASAFPYSYTLKKKAGTAKDSVAYIIKITAPSNENFKGFLVQARIGNTPVGKFVKGQNHKLIDCGAGKENAATHINSNDKKTIQLEWIPPPKLAATVEFVATVARNGGEFWVKQKIGSVTIKNA